MSLLQLSNSKKASEAEAARARPMKTDICPELGAVRMHY